MKHLHSVVLASLAIVTSCGGSKDAPATGSETMELTFNTGDFIAPAGDSFECFYTDTFTPTDKVVGVVGAVGVQQPGGHHIVVYYTDISRPAQHHACVDSEMVQWHQVAGADAAGKSTGTGIAMPPGFAYKVPPGKQLVIQTHYINISGKPRTVNDTVTVKLLPGDKVTTWANQMVYSAESWTIPAKGTLENSTTCKVTKDLKAFLLVGHMHELGKHYKLERLDAMGMPTETVYETDWEASYASHPPLKKWDEKNPYIIPAGTRLRQTCQWNNDTDKDAIFPREMCVFFGFYYPDNGEMFCEQEKTK